MNTELEQKYTMMENIRNDVLHLKESPLYQYRVDNKYLPVVGEGGYAVKTMFVGEFPGENEAKTGRPFCGKSGKILDEMLDLIRLNRSDVYITDLVKDRTPDNREPSPEEVQLYSPFLDRQIEIIKPTLVVTLGHFATEYVLTRFGLKDKIADIDTVHGKSFLAITGYAEVTIIPLYHPAFTLYNESNREILLNDFQVLKKII